MQVLAIPTLGPLRSCKLAAVSQAPLQHPVQFCWPHKGIQHVLADGTAPYQIFTCQDTVGFGMKNKTVNKSHCSQMAWLMTVNSILSNVIYLLQYNVTANT